MSALDKVLVDYTGSDNYDAETDEAARAELAAQRGVRGAQQQRIAELEQAVNEAREAIISISNHGGAWCDCPGCAWLAAHPAPQAEQAQHE